jgi:hypothetical protein
MAQVQVHQASKRGDVREAAIADLVEPPHIQGNGRLA